MKLAIRERYRKRGVRARVTMASIVVLAVTLASGAAGLVALVDQSLQHSLDAAAVTRAEDVSAAAHANGLVTVIPSGGDDSSLVQIINSNGSIVSSSEFTARDRPLLVRPPRRRETTVLTAAHSTDEGYSGPFRIVAEPLELPSGPGWVYVASSLDQVRSATSSLILWLSVGLPILLIIVGTTVWIAVGRALRPVESIRKRAIEIHADFSQRVPIPKSDDEIGRLARTVNDMLDRLAAAADQERQFAGDASHELRSPLAAIRSQVDVALEHPDSSDPQTVFRTIQRQTEEMTDLVEDLLFLARVSEKTVGTLSSPVDIDEILVQEVRRLQHSSAISVKINHLDAARVAGVSRDLARMVSNIGDNAAHYARHEITLGLSVAGSTITITVTDDGPGIAGSDRERIFGRFTRLDDSRSRSASHTGTGLGLAIAQQIAHQHGGSIAAGGRADSRSGAVITISLPYCPN